MIRTAATSSWVVTALLAGSLVMTGMIVAVRASRDKMPPVVRSATSLFVFEDRWLDDSAILKRQDRLQVDNDPVVIRTQPIRFEEDEPVAQPARPAIRHRGSRHERRRDLCQRHGLRKVWVSSRRWRCRR